MVAPDGVDFFELKWPVVHTVTVYQGIGLTSLKSLYYLSIGDAEDGRADKLSASVFCFPQMTRLEFGFDLFQGRPDLLRQEMLQEIYNFGSQSLPSWLEGQMINALLLASSKQLGQVDLSKILCLHLKIFCDDRDPAWKISGVLKMPRLQCFTLEPGWVCNMDACHPLILEGSRDDYLALVHRVRLALNYPAELHFKNALSKKSVARLQETGHSVVCLCRDCGP